MLTPLLNIGVYYLIFGLLLHTNRGVPNFIAFLAVGVFVFAFCTDSMAAGVAGDHRQPRAGPRPAVPARGAARVDHAGGVHAPDLLDGGPHPDRAAQWRAGDVALAGTRARDRAAGLFCLGLAFVVARLGARVPDMAEILPFVTRMWMYTSGVMYSVQVFTPGHAAWVSNIMSSTPATCT